MFVPVSHKQQYFRVEFGHRNAIVQNMSLKYKYWYVIAHRDFKIDTIDDLKYGTLVACRKGLHKQHKPDAV